MCPWQTVVNAQALNVMPCCRQIQHDMLPSNACPETWAVHVAVGICSARTWKVSSERRCCARACAMTRNVSAASGTECLSSISPNKIWLTSCPLQEWSFVCRRSRAAATSDGERCFCRASDTTTLAMCLDGRRPLARIGPAQAINQTRRLCKPTYMSRYTNLCSRPQPTCRCHDTCETR